MELIDSTELAALRRKAHALDWLAAHYTDLSLIRRRNVHLFIDEPLTSESPTLLEALEAEMTKTPPP